jgi:hypothetical protein
MTTRRRKKHHPEKIVAKLRDAEAMLNAGKDLAAVRKPSTAMCLWLRFGLGGRGAKEAGGPTEYSAGCIGGWEAPKPWRK